MPPLSRLSNAPTRTVPLASRANALSVPFVIVTGVAKVMPASRVTATLSMPSAITRR